MCRFILSALQFLFALPHPDELYNKRSVVPCTTSSDEGPEKIPFGGETDNSPRYTRKAVILSCTNMKVSQVFISKTKI